MSRTITVSAALALCLSMQSFAQKAGSPLQCLNTQLRPAESDLLIRKMDDTLLTNWQKKLMGRIWQTEREKGQFIVLPWRSQTDKALLVPYPVRLPIDVAKQFVRLARSNGLKDGDRYVIYPLKMLASTAVTNFFPTVFMVVAYQGVTALDQLGLVTHNPLTTNGDPSDLDEKKVIVVVKFYRDNFAEDGPSYDDGVILKELQDAYPGKILVLDLSSQAKRTSNFKDARTLAIHLEKQGLEIGRLILSAHGSPGEIGTDNPNLSFSIALNTLANQELKGLDRFMAKDAEIHSGACNLAANPYGIKQTQILANTLLKKGGKITVNRTIGLSTPPTFTKAERWTATGFPGVSVLLQGIDGVAGTLKASIDETSREHKTGPLYLEPIQYEYRVIPPR